MADQPTYHELLAGLERQKAAEAAAFPGAAARARQSDF
jgi:hypothetical protein